MYHKFLNTNSAPPLFVTKNWTSICWLKLFIIGAGLSSFQGSYSEMKKSSWDLTRNFNRTHKTTLGQGNWWWWGRNFIWSVVISWSRSGSGRSWKKSLSQSILLSTGSLGTGNLTKTIYISNEITQNLLEKSTLSISSSYLFLSIQSLHNV